MAGAKTAPVQCLAAGDQGAIFRSARCFPLRCLANDILAAKTLKEIAMMRRRSQSWLRFAKRWAPFLAGGCALQINLSGCDPAVRDAVLTGIQTSMTTLFNAVVNAFFLSLQDATSGSATSQSVVQAAFDNLQKWLA